MDWLKSTAVSLYPLSKEEVKPVSVNYFPHRQCNYECKFCFHTTKNLTILPIEEAKRGMRLLADAGMKKMNISGGEPFLKPDFIGEIFRYCKEELHLESCSVVNNGSKVTEKWLSKYGKYLDVMAISCDSFDPEVNTRIGRAEKGKISTHIPTVFEVARMCRSYGVRVKINSVINVPVIQCSTRDINHTYLWMITRYNWEEDMNASIEELAPFRWKVFQVLLLDGENTGESSGSIRDARHLVISDAQFQAFLDRHKDQKSLIPENNEDMKDSYLLLDEEMRFLNSQSGGKVPGRSLLKVGVQEALRDAGFDNDTFLIRGGIFEWGREVQGQESLEW